MWSEFEHQADYSPIAYLGEWERGKKGIAHPSVPKPYRTIKELDGLNMAGGAIDGSYGPLINLDSIVHVGNPMCACSIPHSMSDPICPAL